MKSQPYAIRPRDHGSDRLRVTVFGMTAQISSTGRGVLPMYESFRGQIGADIVRDALAAVQ